MDVVYIEQEAQGAIPNGTLIEKCNTDDPKDAHKDGARGRVTGSVGPLYPPLKDSAGRACTYGYFVRWDDAPHVPIFIVDFRIRPVVQA